MLDCNGIGSLGFGFDPYASWIQFHGGKMGISKGFMETGRSDACSSMVEASASFKEV